MKILVIGCKGFIGSILVKCFVEKGYIVCGSDIVEDLGTIKYSFLKYSGLSNELESIFRNERFDICINAAGNGSVAFSIGNPKTDFEANTYHVIKILDAIRMYQSECKFLQISSAAVYGNPIKLPINECDNLNPLSAYGFNKLMSEMICKEYHTLYNLPIAIIRPFSVYGVGLKKQIFWDTCQKIYRSHNKVISLFGTGKESRDFIYIDDLVALIELIVSKSLFQYDIYNAASGTETTIAEIAHEIEIGIPGAQISFSGIAREGDPINWCADVEKISRLGFKQTITMKEGIQKYLDWFKVNNLNEI